MSRSTGVLSPIQAAGLASPTLLWQALHTPHKESPHSRRNPPFFLSPARVPPPPTSPSRARPSPATPLRNPPSRSASPSSSAPRHPSKRVPSVADIKHDGAVPTPEKQTEERGPARARGSGERGSARARGSGFVTPSKRSIETRRKDASRGSSCAKSDMRTPFATLNFTTPNTSTCSSKTSLSSTASLVTPELYNSKLRARRYVSPGPALQDGFKVPAPSLAPSSVKSRQRLRRL